MQRSTLVHPRTGQPIVPIGYRQDGRPVWPILGGSGESEPPASDPPAGDPPAGDPSAGDPPKDDKNDPNSPTAIETARKEREARKALEKQLAEAKAGQKGLSDLQAALAKALGVAPDEQSDTDKLTAEIAELQKQFADSQRQTTLLQVAAEHEIPKDYLHLLTATDADELDKQAKSIAELVKSNGDGSNSSGSARDAGIGAGGSNTPPDPGPGRPRIRHAIDASAKK